MLHKWRFPEIGVLPNHPCIIGFSLVNHPAIGVPPFRKPPNESSQQPWECQAKGSKYLGVMPIDMRWPSTCNETAGDLEIYRRIISQKVWLCSTTQQPQTPKSLHLHDVMDSFLHMGQRMGLTVCSNERLRWYARSLGHYCNLIYVQSGKREN